jgi:hypothetical protein
MLPILITMQLSLLFYLCVSSLVYLVGPTGDYEKEAADYACEYLGRRRSGALHIKRRKKREKI